MLKQLTFVVQALSLAGCEAAQAKSDSKQADKPGSAAEDSETKLTKLKNLELKAALPTGAIMGDAIGGKGVMVMSATAPVTVTEADKNDPETLDTAKKNVELFKPTNLKTAKLKDGWLLTFDNKGSMGTNYWLKVRRVINGKSFMCNTTVTKPQQREAAIKICKSLTE